jgi:hypothetical protein
MQCQSVPEKEEQERTAEVPHHPPPAIMHKNQQRVTPAEPVVGPKPRVDGVCPGFAYICDAGVGQLAVPLVLDACDLAALVEDVDLAGDGRLLADALDLVHGRHVHLDRVAGRGDAVGFALDFGEGGLQAVLF